MKRLLLLCLVLTLFVHADIRIGVTGNNRGLLTPCGCRIPSGGWARIATMTNEPGPSYVLAGAGNHFFHHTPIPGEDQIFEQKKAAFQASLFSEFAYEAINIGQFDLCYGIKVLNSFREKYDLPFISVNLRDLEGNPVFPPYRIINKDGMDIMFIGICFLTDGFNFKVDDPLETLEALYNDGVFEQADLVILLADTPAKLLSDFVKEHDGIDMIIGAKEHAFTGLPIHYKNTALVQLGSQGKRFGVLNIQFEASGEPWVDISPQNHQVLSIRSALSTETENKKALKRNLKRAKKKLNSAEEKAPNHYIWETTLLDSSVKDDPAIKERVESYTPYLK